MTVLSESPHRLAQVLRAAAEGRFPPVDGAVEVLPPDDAGTEAVVEFTGHSMVLTSLPDAGEVLAGVDGYGGATDPRVLVGLARHATTIGSLDAVMVRRAGPPTGDPLPVTDAYHDHPRVLRARHHRRDVQIYGDERGVVCIGQGLVGRTELSVEVVRGGDGRGRGLVLSALANLAPEELVFAQVSPGNAASVRAFLACGFVPIGSEVLILGR